MNEKILEVQNYFKQKILSKEYNIESIREYEIVLIIDGIYKFPFWGGNIDIPNARKLYGNYFMELNLTESDILKIHANLKPLIENFIVNELISKKEEELNVLKSKIIN